MLVGFAVLIGCEEAFFEEDQPNDPVANFEYLWQNFEERYALFDFKGINWNQVYTDYRPRISDQMSGDQLFEIMSEMLNLLKDGHTNLRSPIDISRYGPYLEAPPNYDAELMERNYLRNA
ncbi:MAG: hypothetical protein KTR24_05485, partial [Saprospiraceae bacterium]|nr:hypothetical protein [Saprospiraceae bacterium]